MKRKLWKIWQKWLRISIPVNLISWIFFVCCIDSETLVPTIICLINGVWLCLIAISNSRGENDGKIQRHNRNEIWETDTH